MNLSKLTLVVIFLLSANSFAQKIIGDYSQISLIAPDEYRDSENEVVIEKDIKSNKKIWIKHLIPNQRFYAIKYLSNEDGVIYSVPKQTIGNYLINIGCVIFETEDDSNTVNINLNNKDFCSGISQKDYQTEIKVGNDGVKVGDIEINKSGKVNVNKDVSINKKEININTKKLMSGIQYLGKKQ